MTFRAGLAALLVLGFCGAPAMSATQKCNPPSTQADEQACTPDVNEKCGQFIPDRDAIINCLNDKKKHHQLSVACNKVMSRPYNKNLPTCSS